MFITGLTYGRLSWNRLRHCAGHPPGPAVFHRRDPHFGRNYGWPVLQSCDYPRGGMDHRADSGAEMRGMAATAVTVRQVSDVNAAVQNRPRESLWKRGHAVAGGQPGTEPSTKGIQNSFSILTSETFFSTILCTRRTGHSFPSLSNARFAASRSKRANPSIASLPLRSFLRCLCWSVDMAQVST